MPLGGLAGLITAGQMAHAYGTPPHASALYACMEPGWLTSIHWIGDCRAYGWDGTALTQWSTDQTMGPAPATCRQVEIPEEVRLVLLVSDGLSDQVEHEAAEELCRSHEADPQGLAEALVAAAETAEDGYRDDTTGIALLMHRA
ncbi:hypothetical protein ACIQU4_28530 [Streptomyces sp. NPDC090741]|uniref:hypothetical protein n=1 Tax=Streptomyces sp. NPDC090741 TaxID=3365967 RepID=UPI00380BCCAD